MNQLVKVREQTGMEAKKPSYWWWLESHYSSMKRSKWLSSTLAELDQKTKAMLQLIDEDADSFAQRAEMFYKKRPELISMVEELYRAHRSLAERFEQLKNDPGSRITSPRAHPLSSPKSPFQKLSSSIHSHGYAREAYGSDESGDSEIDDPSPDTPVCKGNERKREVTSPFVVDYEDVMKLSEEIKKLKDENEFQNQVIKREAKVQQELRAQLSETSIKLRTLKEEIEELVAAKTSKKMKKKGDDSDEVTRLREEVETLRAENVDHKKQLMQKDEEKREVIRQLSISLEMQMEENSFLKKSITKKTLKKTKPVESHKFKGFEKLFNFLPRPQTTIVPL
ncbi:hypothetical protein Droror1_Dr00019856 [Drosera rotundifolia]